MKAILLYLFFFGLTISAIGQERIIIDAGKQPYMLVDTFTVELKSLVISPDKIESINVLKDSNAVSLYGDKARHGAVIIKTKPNTSLLRIGEVLTRYNILKADQKLRICVNKNLVSQPELLLIEETQILGVEITTDRYWMNTEDANTNEKFINIKTARTERNG